MCYNFIFLHFQGYLGSDMTPAATSGFYSKASIQYIIGQPYKNTPSGSPFPSRLLRPRQQHHKSGFEGIACWPSTPVSSHPPHITHQQVLVWLQTRLGNRLPHRTGEGWGWWRVGVTQPHSTNLLPLFSFQCGFVFYFEGTPQLYKWWLVRRELNNAAQNWAQ